MPKLSFSAKKALCSFISCGGDIDKEEIREIFSSRKLIRGLISDLDQGLYEYSEEVTPEEMNLYNEINHFLYEILEDPNIKE